MKRNLARVLLLGGAAGMFAGLRLGGDAQVAVIFFALVAGICGLTLMLDFYIMKGATRCSRNRLQ